MALALRDIDVRLWELPPVAGLRLVGASGKIGWDALGKAAFLLAAGRGRPS
jgi:hypothetical protein